MDAAKSTPSRWRQATCGDTAAWRELAGSYWYCVYAWWRRAGHAEADTLTVSTPPAGPSFACVTPWSDAPAFMSAAARPVSEILAPTSGAVSSRWSPKLVLSFAPFALAMCEALARFDAALGRDPHNGQIAEEIRDTNRDVRNWPAGIRAADLALTFDPESPSLRVERAYFDQYSKGDVQPVRAVLASITSQQDAVRFFVFDRWSTAMLARDFAGAARAIDEQPDQPIVNSQ